MKIAIGCDHGGYLLKQDILIWLEEHDIDFEDVGCYNTDSVDYPVYGEKVARLVAGGECDKGIVICTTGNVIAMGAGIVGPKLAERMVEVFLNTEFEGGRHARRVGLLDSIQP